MTVFARNVTAARKEAELRLGELYSTLVDVSRQRAWRRLPPACCTTWAIPSTASTSPPRWSSTSCSRPACRGSPRSPRCCRSARPSWRSFLSLDPQGKLLPAYIAALSEHLHREHGTLLQERRALSASVEHIKSVISMQQKHARVAGAEEEVSLPVLIDEALRLHAVSFERLGIRPQMPRLRFLVLGEQYRQRPEGTKSRWR